MRNPIPFRSISGFTLIELMISITLGLVLLLTCFAGLRLTAQTVVASKQLSEENALLRLGVEKVWDEADFWTMCDDPNNSSAQQLRGSCPSGGFQPFTPFSQTPDYSVSQSGTTGFQDSNAGFDEVEQPAATHGGWNPSPLAWAAWNPRTWTRAIPCEKASANESFGTCEIFDNLDPTLSWHYWYDDQVRGIMDALGFYGTFEYLPSNAHIIYHGTTPPLGNKNGLNGMTWGWCPQCLMTSGWFAVYDGADDNMKGRERNSNGSRYFFPGPSAQGTDLARTYADFGYNGRNQGGGVGGTFNMGQVTTALANSDAGAEMMPLRPAGWNDVTFETHRFIERGHPLCICEVTCASSRQGSNFMIPFTCVCTTLRGARQQRTPTASGGWVVNPYTDATLDYANPP